MGSTPPVAETVLGPDDLIRMQRTASQVFVHHALVDYVVRLVIATRAPREHGMDDVASWVSYGASPRASLGLIAASRARSEEHTSELQSRQYLVCRLLL